MKAGIVVTKTLAFAGGRVRTVQAGGGGGRMFYAYDKMTGSVVHEMQLPANTCGNPMTYAVNESINSSSPSARRISRLSSSRCRYPRRSELEDWKIGGLIECCRD